MNTVQSKISPFLFAEIKGDPLTRLVEKIKHKQDSIQSIQELAAQVLSENEVEFFPSPYWEEEIRPAILEKDCLGTSVRTVAIYFFNGRIPGLDEKQKEELRQACLQEHGIDICQTGESLSLETPQQNHCCVIS